MTAADIRFYFSIALRWLPTAVVVTAVTTAVALYVALVLPPVYKATATIVVDGPALPTQLARSIVPENTIAQVQLAREQLMQTAALATLAEDLDLQPEQLGASGDLIEAIRDKTDLEQIHFGANDQIINAFTISFSAADPDIAAMVANRFASDILEDDLDRRQQRASSTLTFFEDDATSLERDLQASEAALLQFRNENIGALPESLSFRRTQIASAQAELADLQKEEVAARLRRANLVSQRLTTGQVGDGPETPEATTLGELRQSLASQLAIFAPDSPSIVSLRQRITSLEEGLTDATADTGAAVSSSPGEIEELDARLAEIEAEKQALAITQSSLQASLLATPANESRLRAMELDRDNIQAQYTDAVARLSEASTGERMETLLKGERLTLFQEALPPIYPVSPQRRLIVAAGVLGGLGLVFALAIMLEMLNAKVRRPADLQRKLSMQPLGVIPVFKRTRRQVRAMQISRTYSADTALGRRQSWTM